MTHTGYASQTLPRNLNISANATYGNIPASASPAKLHQHQMLMQHPNHHVQQQQQQQSQAQQQQQDSRSVSPDLVSKRQLKDQMGE